MYIWTEYSVTRTDWAILLERIMTNCFCESIVVKEEMSLKDIFYFSYGGHFARWSVTIMGMIHVKLF